MSGKYPTDRPNTARGKTIIYTPSMVAPAPKPYVVEPEPQQAQEEAPPTPTKAPSRLKKAGRGATIVSAITMLALAVQELSAQVIPKTPPAQTTQQLNAIALQIEEQHKAMRALSALLIAQDQRQDLMCPNTCPKRTPDHLDALQAARSIARGW